MPHGIYSHGHFDSWRHQLDVRNTLTCSGKLSTCSQILYFLATSLVTISLSSCSSLSSQSIQYDECWSLDICILHEGCREHRCSAHLDSHFWVQLLPDNLISRRIEPWLVGWALSLEGDFIAVQYTRYGWLFPGVDPEVVTNKGASYHIWTLFWIT